MDGQLDHAVEAFDFERDATIERRMRLICLEVKDNGQEYEEVEQRKRKIKRRTPRSLQAKQQINNESNHNQNDNASNDFEASQQVQEQSESNARTETTEPYESPVTDDSQAQPSKIVFPGPSTIWPTEDFNGTDDFEDDSSLSEKVLYDYSTPLL